MALLCAPVARRRGDSRGRARRHRSRRVRGGQTQPLGRVTVSGGVATFPTDATTGNRVVGSPIGTCIRPSSRAGIGSVASARRRRATRKDAYR